MSSVDNLIVVQRRDVGREHLHLQSPVEPTDEESYGQSGGSSRRQCCPDGVWQAAAGAIHGGGSRTELSSLLLGMEILLLLDIGGQQR